MAHRSWRSMIKSLVFCLRSSRISLVRLSIFFHLCGATPQMLLGFPLKALCM